MLSSDGLISSFERIDIREPTRRIIQYIRSSPPSRRVGGGRSNVSGRYPSKKMGVTIQFESHHVELAGIYEMEHEDGVLEYFDQPPSIQLEYGSPNGRRMGVRHNPDFIFTMIASGVLYVDLRAAVLAEPSKVKVFAAPATTLRAPSNGISNTLCPSTDSLRSGSRISWDGRNWDVVNVGETTVGLLSD